MPPDELLPNKNPVDPDNGSQLLSAQATDNDESKQEIVKQASELLRPQLSDPSKAPKLVRQIVGVMETHRGPLPHPKILGGYNAVVPGSAREILDMAKAEQAHRHRIDNRESLYPYAGLVLGAVALFLCLGGAIYVGLTSPNATLPLALVGAPIASAIGWIINARIKSKVT